MLVVLLACLVWALSLILPQFLSGVPQEPDIGVAVMGVLGAALAFPEINNFRQRNGNGNGNGNSDDHAESQPGKRKPDRDRDDDRSGRQ
jgi:hypothetical protein